MVAGSARLGPLSDYIANDRPVLSEGAPQKQHLKFQTTTHRQEVISVRKFHKGARHQDTLTG
jgi:hypothetical protein